jgi:hypothetical protein
MVILPLVDAGYSCGREGVLFLIFAAEAVSAISAAIGAAIGVAIYYSVCNSFSG